MKVRNLFSLSDNTLVSGEELWQFLHEEQPYRFGSAGRHLLKYFRLRLECYQWEIDRNATYIIEHRPWHGYECSRKMIWFRKLPGSAI